MLRIAGRTLHRVRDTMQSRAPRRGPKDDDDIDVWVLGNQCARHALRRLGTKASLRERGRRRTRQDQISRGALRPPVKLRTTDPHRTKKTCFFCQTGFRRELLERTIQPFDLMSRRHPLSSTRAVRVLYLLREANRPESSCDVPASSRRQFSQARFTSSSWRPCGSSSQSSSLRSSPSSPS